MKISACVFDAYGTLLDVHAAVRAHAGRIGPEADAVSALWRTKQLEYTWVRSLMGRHADFAAVTAEALDHALAVHGVAADAGLRADLLAAYRDILPVLIRHDRDLTLASALDGESIQPVFRVR